MCVWGSHEAVASMARCFTQRSEKSGDFLPHFCPFTPALNLLWQVVGLFVYRYGGEGKV